MALLRIAGLPADPLAASAAFYAGWLEGIRAADGDLVLAFDPADHTHRAWRLAAVQGLAREREPLRINAIAGGSEAAIASACSYLDAASGLTGQYLPLDDVGAGPVVSSAE